MCSSDLAKEALQATPGVRVVHDSAHFNEFAIEVQGTAEACLAYLDANGITGGFDLTRWYPDTSNQVLVTTTDQTSASDIDALCAQLALWSTHLEVAA